MSTGAAIAIAAGVLGLAILGGFYFSSQARQAEAAAARAEAEARAAALARQSGGGGGGGGGGGNPLGDVIGGLLSGVIDLVL